MNSSRFLPASRCCSALLAGVLLLSACGGGGGDTSGGGSATPPTVAITRAEAARFLKQASFGPNSAQLERVIQLGYAAWIDEQMAVAPTSHLAGLAAEEAHWPTPYPGARTFLRRHRPGVHGEPEFRRSRA